MENVIEKHSRQSPKFLVNGLIPFEQNVYCLCLQDHSRDISIILSFELTEVPLGIKPIFTRAEGKKIGTSHFTHVRLHCIANWSQWRTHDGVRDAPGQTGLIDEQVANNLFYTVSRRLLGTYVYLPNHYQDLYDVQ